MPALLQTEEYARAIILQGAAGVDPDEVERWVALRTGRQKLLTRENPPRYWVIMDEAALRGPMGGRDVHVAQIEQLMNLVGEPTITLQVMPFGTVATRPTAARSPSCGSRERPAERGLHGVPDRRALH